MLRVGGLGIGLGLGVRLGLGLPECAKGFVEVVVGGADRGHHERLCVAAQGRLQESAITNTHTHE